MRFKNSYIISYKKSNLLSVKRQAKKLNTQVNKRQIKTISLNLTSFQDYAEDK